VEINAKPAAIVNDEVPRSVVPPRKQAVKPKFDKGLDQRFEVFCSDP
jgi:hypothetical protein